VLVIVSALLSVITATVAPAARFRIPEQNLRSTGVITGRTPEGAIIRCTAIMTGFIGGTIMKVAGSPVGRITEVLVERCTGGTLIPANLPWDKTYRGFTGTLPNITQAKFDIWRIWMARGRTPFGEFTCRYGSTPTSGSLILPEGETYVVDESVTIRSETPFCPSMTESGRLAVMPPIPVSLI